MQQTEKIKKEDTTYLGIRVTLFACMAQRTLSSNRVTRKASAASCTFSGCEHLFIIDCIMTYNLKTHDGSGLEPQVFGGAQRLCDFPDYA